MSDKCSKCGKSALMAADPFARCVCLYEAQEPDTSNGRRRAVLAAAIDAATAFDKTQAELDSLTKMCGAAFEARTGVSDNPLHCELDAGGHNIHENGKVWWNNESGGGWGWNLPNGTRFVCSTLKGCVSLHPESRRNGQPAILCENQERGHEGHHASRSCWWDDTGAYGSTTSLNPVKTAIKDHTQRPACDVCGCEIASYGNAATLKAPGHSELPVAICAADYPRVMELVRGLRRRPEGQTSRKEHPRDLLSDWDLLPDAD
jgi:hypothetical protein